MQAYWLKLKIWKYRNPIASGLSIFGVSFVSWLILQAVFIDLHNLHNKHQQAESLLAHEILQDLIQEKLTNHE